MFINILPGNTKKVLKSLKNLEILRGFYLTGGTALSLQIGHRESEDLDFFTKNSFSSEQLLGELETVNRLKGVEISKGTLNCFLEDVKLQFLNYPYTILEPFLKWEGVNISSTLDIACTKLITISARGSKKDFIDIYFLLKEFTLKELIEKLKEKYPNTNYNETHILKSLVYFKEADNQPSPRMHQEIDWKQVKGEIVDTIKNFEI